MSRSDEPSNPWPVLPVDHWHDTLTTLHLWTQIVGKVRLGREPTLAQGVQNAVDVEEDEAPRPRSQRVPARARASFAGGSTLCGAPCAPPCLQLRRPRWSLRARGALGGGDRCPGRRRLGCGERVWCGEDASATNAAPVAPQPRVHCAQAQPRAYAPTAHTCGFRRHYGARSMHPCPPLRRHPAGTGPPGFCRRL